MAADMSFAAQMVRWQKSHGRSHLPWQQTRDPYRVWLSEVMLQQTTVAAVKPYFESFLARWPRVEDLAAAPTEAVMSAWAGLGYYSRARNLHACACAVVAQHGGAFPRTAEVLQTLPGIGRSTAAAIASFCFGERVAILDANVKRVLTRVLGFSDDLAVAAHERVLWGLATELLPHEALDTTMPRYTQGLMDIGATVCLPRKPVCLVCPLHAMCVARRVGNPELYPVKTRKLKRSAESWWLLLARDTQGRVWLQRRPAKGIWAGLYCLPVFADRAALEAVVPPRALAALQDGAPFLHVLTHKDLHLHPVQWVAGGANAPATEGAWVAADKVLDMGLPAPVRKLLEAELARGLQPA